KSDMFIPILSKGRSVGLIRLGSCRVAGFTMDDASVAEKLAYQVGIALENTRLIKDLEEMLLNTVQALASAIDAKSPWTRGHSERVTEYSLRVAREMGMTGKEIERLRLAGLLHDVGKIGTYDVILDKPGRLTPEEFELVKKHPDRGCEILAPIKQFKDLLPIIRHHHERWDGRGYPLGLKGEEIPLMSRILCAADTFDSMTADRPYRAALDPAIAFEELKLCAGTQFEPRVAELFIKVLKD
ncbi:MAG TPA: HD domain-containing phosphohydrolase, partial [Nitrospirota bacterium]|nr:HD domain-containing phosphohydrolase [Nitrospirota bacterium]